MHTNWSPEDLPLGCEQSKGHLNPDPQLAQEEVAGSIGWNAFHCSTEWNENFVRQRTSIVSNQEVLVRQIVNPLSQFNAPVECSCVVGSSRTNHTKVDESKLSIHHLLDIHTIALIVSTEVVSAVVNFLWFVYAAEPSIDGTNTAMEDTKGA